MRVKFQILISFLLCLSTSFAESGWEQRAFMGAEGRHRGAAGSTLTKGYMGFGHYNGAGPNIVKKDWWEYDPATNSWTQKADYIGGSNGTYAPVIFSFDNFVCVGGGQWATNNNFYKFDPTLNMWIQVASIPASGVVMNVEGFVIDDKGYIMDDNVLYEYDSSNDSWTAKASPAPAVWAWNSCFTIGEKGYLKSGSAFYEYKPTTDTWITRASFPGLATSGSVGFSQNNKGYIVTGFSGGLSNINSEVWEYDPLTNTWKQLPEFPGASRRFAVGFSVGNRSFIGLGTNGTNFNDLWEFNATTLADSLAGLDNLNLSNKTIITYPNPVQEYIHVESEEFSSFEVFIFNMKGQLVLDGTTINGKLTLEREQLDKGTYTYMVRVNNKIIHQDKLILI